MKLVLMLLATTWIARAQPLPARPAGQPFSPAFAGTNDFANRLQERLDLGFNFQSTFRFQQGTKDRLVDEKAKVSIFPSSHTNAFVSSFADMTSNSLPNLQFTNRVNGVTVEVGSVRVVGENPQVAQPSLTRQK